ncbi:MAG: hypothetical protein ACRDGJ_05675 [Candidatus Limnocylindria bacterium]
MGAALAGALALVPASTLASSDTQTFLLVAEAPNLGVAASGDTIEITCVATEHVCGTFSIHPKSIEASGEFAHFLPDGSLFASGTWTATGLISFHPYGCGEVLGEVIPPDLCGGAVKFAATFSTPFGELDGIITVFCIVGPKAPSSHDDPSGEGVTVVVPGIVNFNHTGGGDNIFVET